MSINLLKHVSDQLSDSTTTKFASLMGMEKSAAGSAVKAALPTILKAIVSRGDTAENASSLRNFIRTNNIASNVATDFLNLDNNSTRDYLNIGSKATDFLFGGAKDSLVGNIAKRSGLGADKGSKLTNLLAPLALGHVSKLANKENYTDVQLASYLKSQKEHLMDSTVKRSTETVRTKHVAEKETVTSASSSGGGLFKWLIPLLGLLGLLWWFSQKGCATDVAQSETTEIKPPTRKTETTTTQTKPNVEVKTTQSNIEVKSDQPNVKVTTTSTDEASKIASTTTEAVSSSAQNAGGFLKTFSTMLSSKDKVGTSYALSQIVFDKESHKITNFSKAEVEGLANALKAIPGAKIQVQVHSNDGGDKTKLRAQVVKDMLVTLGVDKGQISSKGMGDDDKTKAAADKVEIKVEAVN